MFGSILGTLQCFSMDEKKKKQVTEKKQEVEKKIDEKTEKEKEELKVKRRELLDEQRSKKQDIRVLQAQMQRVEVYEEWEKSKKSEKCFIRTTKGSNPVYWIPSTHTSKTHSLLQDSRDRIEKEIEERKEAFEAELVEIEQRLKFDRRRLGDRPKENGGEGKEEEEEGGFMSDRKVVERGDEKADKEEKMNGHSKEEKEDKEKTDSPSPVKKEKETREKENEDEKKADKKEEK